jgi:hypothetical protein
MLHTFNINYFKNLQQKYPSHEIAPLKPRIKYNIALPKTCRSRLIYFKDLQQKNPSHETAPLKQRKEGSIGLPKLLQEQAPSLRPLVASVVLLSCLYLSILKNKIFNFEYSFLSIKFC